MTLALFGVLSFFALSFLLAGGLMFRAYLKTRPTFVTKLGMRVFLDEGLEGRVNPDDLDENIRMYNQGMVPPFTKSFLSERPKGMRVELSSKKVFTKNRPEHSGLSEGYNGLTFSPSHIAVACDKKLCWDKDGKVDITRTAFDYEYHNTCIWEHDSYDTCYAESFLKPDDERQWRAFRDADTDGDVDAEDVKIWKARRDKYDELYSPVKKSINKLMRK